MNQWPKDALIPDLARGCCHRSRRGPASNLATGSNINDSFWVSGCGRLPFSSHKRWQASKGLQAPDWHPKEVRQGRGAPGGSSQGPNSTLKSFSSRWGLAPASATSCKSVLKKLINIKSSFIVLLVFIGIDQKGRQILGKSHL